MTDHEFERVVAILHGIDQTETQSADGWWETSAGAAFGKAKLTALRGLVQAPNPYERDGQWYWFDESEQESLPYPTSEEAQIDLILYGHYLTTGGDLRAEIMERWRVWMTLLRHVHVTGEGTTP